ncbi:hypothetical protein FACS189451_06560 [Bacteroidia bacterium]|nr:hypothetical protein FACS189446_2370 [Bacteroidia bacterium]GHT62373.1 hypothetical protein FACS189451_06560 [Bacteroidia bacterium]
MKKSVLFIVAALVVCMSAPAQMATKPAKVRESAVDRRSLPQMEVKKMEKAKVKTLNAKFGLNSPVKQVLSTKKSKDGSEFRLVRLENGRIKKQLVNPSKQLQRKIQFNKKLNQNANSQSVAAAAESLHEGFEGWDGEASDWLPDGWTDESKVGSPSYVEDVYGDAYDFTWRPTWAYAKSGLYSAGVQFSTDIPLSVLSDKDENGDGDLDTIPYFAPSPQDEWLYSPEVTVKQADYVFAFDLNYDPFWARFRYDDEEEEYKFDAMHTVVEALISTDGGVTWTSKWDNREDAAGYTEDELWDVMFETGPLWLSVSINLAEYLNKDIKIAVRYWDDGGESVYVDNVVVGYQIPEASYRRPTGYLISGLSPDYYNLTGLNLIVGNAYTPTQWRGIVKNADAVNWNFSDYTSSSEVNPVVTLPYGLYETPVLTATNKGGPAEFQLGIEGDDNYMALGGNNWRNVGLPEPMLFGLGNYDLNYEIMRYSDINAEDLAPYGTFRGVANYFEKPANTYMIETFYVHAGNVVAKPGEPVLLNIYDVTEEYQKGELIATAEANPEDFILATEDDGLKYYTIPFKFMVVDPETGREEEGYLDMKDDFIAEFYNYQSADVFFQYEDHPTGDGYASVSFEERFLSLGATSALFDMDATFPFLAAIGDDRYAAPEAGGTKDFEVAAYWRPTVWYVEEGAVPDWIVIGEPIEKTDDGEANCSIPVTVAPLPAGVAGRKADVTIYAPGCELNLEIKQGESWWTGIDPVSPAKNVKVVNQGDRFVLTHPAGNGSVTIYSVTGQKVAEYALNPNGTTSIPAANWAKGVYVLKVAGKTNETVKVIK